MEINEFVTQLGEQVKKHAAKRKRPVFFLSTLMDSGPRLRAGKNECHCPITYLYDKLRGDDDALCQVHQFGEAAAFLGLSEDDAEIIVSAADNLFMIGEKANDAARALRPKLIEACGLDAAGGV